METAPLKSFATWARTALISEVAARIAAVLAPGSSERVEQERAITALEKAVTSAGGSEKGRAAVADKVAYTWFNRIVALRFMDANSYTGIGVVSPQARVELGQPEILAEAKRGVIDTEVVGQTTRTAVAGLLDGTRSSSDPQGEAYALLLTEYCRHWNRAMPFMFEREGDFTELLIPANLLADGSVLNRSVKVLTEDVCKDVEVIGWLYQFYISERKDEVFAGFKKNKKAGADEIPAATQLFTPHWIVRYLVENSLGRLWMLNRPSSGLTRRMDYYIAPVDEETDYLKITKPEDLKVIDPACGSGHMLTYAFDLLYAIYEEEGYAPSDIPGLILTHNLYGAEIDPRAGSLAAFALTMKARSRQRSFLTKAAEPNICVLERISFTSGELNVLISPSDSQEEATFWNAFNHADVFGSLITPTRELVEPMRERVQAAESKASDLIAFSTFERARQVVEMSTLLASEYHVVLANPPYMGSKTMGPALAEFAKKEFPDCKSDLFAMFIDRCARLACPTGLVGMITMQSWMFLSSHEKLRKRILASSPPVVMAHLGEKAFGSIGGSVVSTTAFVLIRGHLKNQRAVYYRLVGGASEEDKKKLALECVRDPEGPLVSTASAEAFSSLPGSPLAYSLPSSALAAYASGERLGDSVYGQPGLQTSSNARFLRFWFEVPANRIGFGIATSQAAAESGLKWFPYLKGGEFRKWYGNELHVVDWQHDGKHIKEYVSSKYEYLNGNVDYVVKDRGYYFKPMVTYTKISSGRFSARAARAGYLFDVAGSAVFPDERDFGLVLGFLCSRLGEMFLRAMNPTLNVQAGDIDKLPFVRSLLDSRSGQIGANVAELIRITKRDWDLNESSWEFSVDPIVQASRSALPATPPLAELVELIQSKQSDEVEHSRQLEADLDTLFFDAYSIPDGAREELATGLLSSSVRDAAELAGALISYAVGCIVGRFSLDEPGLVLATEGASYEDYFAKVSSPRFTPDADNVIPIVDGDWFEDDIVGQFRRFLRTAFGEEHFEENLRFVTDSLGVKNLRDYFVKSFYKDHVQRYNKRPIYWLFSSPKGSFNALIYMHRYTPTTVSTVLNEYLREFQAKLTASLEHAERSNDAKEADRLRKVLLELDEYEHDVLYPLASQNIAIDLDDGVKANYPKFGAALKRIPGVST